MNSSTEHLAPANGCAVDCTADSAGGLTFDVPAAELPHDAALVLRRRGPCAGQSAEEVLLPLTDVDGGRWRAVLPSTVALAEGHWDVRHGAVDGGGRLRTGARDVAALNGRVPEAGLVTARVPYPTADGGLALRSWVRAPHAEAGEVHCLPGAVTVEGVLYGSGTGGGAGGPAVVEARPRGGGAAHRVPATGRGGVFAFTLPYGPLAAASAGRRQWWDLWLVPEAGSAAARIARILDDAWDKRRWALGPAQESGGARAVPRYTQDNGLSVRLDPARVPAPAVRRGITGDFLAGR
ncbi:hypothetical protein [Streptomyces sp. NBC_01497]|uniref:hypothetical protein n=1 Tax=Streptomyces sp. NBC_01497 TaxID=2903885 RepID=UPI002E351CC7|nr:hypothetical protein [Streptomyces sp. NBC_01497]